jgi:hypothetical protein
VRQPPSQFEEREIKWELGCLNNRTTDVLEVSGLMTKDEMNYFDKLQDGIEVLAGKHYKELKSEKPVEEYRKVYRSFFLDAAGLKEVECMFMKMVDDNCARTPEPRIINPTQVFEEEAEVQKPDESHSKIVSLVHQTFSASSLSKAKAAHKAKVQAQEALKAKAASKKAGKKDDGGEESVVDDGEGYDGDGETAMGATEDDPDFICPIELPTGPGSANENQEPYFDRLHEMICDGVGFLNGTMDESGNELLFNMYKEELKCMYSMVLKDNCGGLPSQFSGTREIGWDLYCLDHTKRITDVYGIMTKEEQFYYNKLVRGLESQQVFKTFFSLSLGYKEVVCMVLKTIDDDCAALAAPRQMDPHSLFAAEYGHPPRGPEDLRAASEKLLKLAKKVKALDE